MVMADIQQRIEQISQLVEHLLAVDAKSWNDDQIECLHRHLS